MRAHLQARVEELRTRLRALKPEKKRLAWSSCSPALAEERSRQFQALLQEAASHPVLAPCLAPFSSPSRSYIYLAPNTSCIYLVGSVISGPRPLSKPGKYAKLLYDLPI